MFNNTFNPEVSRRLCVFPAWHQWLIVSAFCWLVCHKEYWWLAVAAGYTATAQPATLRESYYFSAQCGIQSIQQPPLQETVAQLQQVVVWAWRMEEDEEGVGLRWHTRHLARSYPERRWNLQLVSWHLLVWRSFRAWMKHLSWLLVQSLSLLTIKVNSKTGAAISIKNWGELMVSTPNAEEYEQLVPRNIRNGSFNGTPFYIGAC